MAEWLARRPPQWMTKSVSGIGLSPFETGLKIMTLLVHNWDLPYRQCMGTCSTDSSPYQIIYEQREPERETVKDRERRKQSEIGRGIYVVMD